MILIPVSIFLVITFDCLFYQLRNPKIQNRCVNMLDYVFFSNFTVQCPKWFTFVLFFNWRLTKLPISLIILQISNYIMLAVSLILRCIVKIDDLKYFAKFSLFHIGILFIYWIFVIVDFSIYTRPYKPKKG